MWMLKALNGTYSSGNCFGLAPNSLLILATRWVTKNHKPVVKVVKNTKKLNYYSYVLG